ncbi:MAG: class I SAM-dependent methyltransferase [Thermoanaerobaculia bacterium]
MTEIPPFRATHEFEGTFINERHRSYSTCPAKEHLLDLGIDGWLRREDALKLYELAYFAVGPILEIGSYHGLSTSILAGAAKDSGRGQRIVSVELDVAAQDVARKHLQRLDLAPDVSFIQADAESFCDRAAAAGEQFDFVFVDHDHSYAAVLPVCRQMASLVPEGGFVLLHDWLDARNFAPGAEDYGVFGATIDGLDPLKFDFYGAFGVTGLFRKQAGGSGFAQLKMLKTLG